MSDPVRVERNGPVTTVIIDRPAARNAVNGPTAAALFTAFEEFDRDDAASVAVLWGDNGTFCAGADLKAFGTPDANAVHRTGPGPMGPTRMVLSKPVIAAVSGYAVAGGLELALWCDLRVADQDAVFGVFCRRWGVPLIDGGTVRLPRSDRAKPRDGHDPDRPLCGRRRSTGDGVGKSSRAQRSSAPGGRGSGGATGSAAAAVHALRSTVGAAPMGDARGSGARRRVRQLAAGRRRGCGGSRTIRRGRGPARCARGPRRAATLAGQPLLTVLPEPRLSTFGLPSL